MTSVLCTLATPPPPILIDDQEEQEWAGWGHLPGGTGTSSFILSPGGESQLHPQADSFFPHVFFLERSQKLGTVAVQEEAGSLLTCILHAFLSRVNLQV